MLALIIVKHLLDLRKGNLSYHVRLHVRSSCKEMSHYEDRRVLREISI